MPKYRIAFAQYFEAEMEAEDEDMAISELREIYDLYENWIVEDIEEFQVYGFLCYDQKKEYPYGIELSDTEDGNEIFDIEWYASEEERRKSINASPEWIFPREKV